MPVGLAGFDRRRLGTAACLVGIDEAGRGALAGPVVAAAVCCGASFYRTSWCRRNAGMVADSKTLQPGQRGRVVQRYQYARNQEWIRIGIGMASVEEIEQFNIYHANSLAMRRSLEAVAPGGQDPLYNPEEASAEAMVLLIDGKPIRSFPVAHEGVVKGDQRSLAVALAGIHAKEHRDALLRQLDRRYPQYGFARHKGYGTEEHLSAIRRHGPTPLHRPSFLRKLLQPPRAKEQERQDSLF